MSNRLLQMIKIFSALVAALYFSYLLNTFIFSIPQEPNFQPLIAFVNHTKTAVASIKPPSFTFPKIKQKQFVPTITQAPFYPTLAQAPTTAQPTIIYVTRIHPPVVIAEKQDEEPTEEPTLEPTPIFATFAPQNTSTPIPTRKPTIKPNPTRIPTKTPVPSPTLDPLKQPWYGAKSGACYATLRMIQVYANNASIDSCYKSVQSAVSSQLTSVSIMGKSVTIHKKAYPAFKRVADSLEAYKKGKSYVFGTKTYSIRNIGGYVFRCNVNASTSGKNDVCDPGCVLSPHSFGFAVDINSDTNPNGSTSYDMPKELSDTFEREGFRWGGHYPLIGSYIDPMHFEYMEELCSGV